MIPEHIKNLLPDKLLHPNPYIYLTDNFVVFDLETTSKGDDHSPSPCWEENSIVCGSWCCGMMGATRNIYGNEYEMQELVDALESADFCVAHNGKFDLGWLLRAGIDLSKILLYDTMIGEYVALGNRLGKTTKDSRGKARKPLSLDNLLTIKFWESKDPFVDICIKGKVDVSELPKSMVIKRCNSDVRMTRKLFLLQSRQLYSAGLLPCMYTSCLLTPILADIESKGMCVDADAVDKQYTEAVASLVAVTAEMDEFTGGVNPRSPKQMKEFIYETLKFKPPISGYGKNQVPDYTTETDKITQLKATTSKQKKFIELKKRYARHHADVSKALQFYQGVATDDRFDAPIFYAKLNQCNTKTHRLSSSGIKRVFTKLKDAGGKAIQKGIQFQNMPRKYKPLIRARLDDWLITEIDASQLEFRVAAHLGSCPVATQEIIDGVDVHKQSASVINNCKKEEVTKAQRTSAKSHTFKPLYHGTKGTVDEERYYKWFKEHYIGITKTQQEWIDESLATKKLKLPTGFIAYFPGAKLTRSGYVTDSTKICNLPVQNLATAEIIPIAIIFLWHLMLDMESYLINTVHDSGIIETHPDEIDRIKEYGLYSFTILTYYYLSATYGIELVVPLGIEIKTGRNWGTGDEHSIDTLPPGRLEDVDYSKLNTNWR
jgi:DNA polymerase I-like protein with 3'-5' exonuclease and polymerase domains